MNLIPELFGYSNKNPYLCIVIDKNRYSFTYPIGMVPFWIHTHYLYLFKYDTFN